MRNDDNIEEEIKNICKELASDIRHQLKDKDPEIIQEYIAISAFKIGWILSEEESLNKTSH